MESVSASSFFLEGVLKAPPLADVRRAETLRSYGEMCRGMRADKNRAGGTVRAVFAPGETIFPDCNEDVLCGAFPPADEVIFVLPGGGSGFSQVEERLCGLYASCRAKRLDGTLQGTDFLVARSLSEAMKHCLIESSAGDSIIVFSDKQALSETKFDVDFITGKSQVPKDLKPFSFFKTGGRSYSGGERFIVGSGSNLWISDLSTDVDFVKSSGPASVPGSTLRIPWMAGIPGTLGGWVKMNAGAFGHSISEVVSRVKVDGRWIEKRECGFSYRSSSIEGVIEDVELDDEKISRLQNESRFKDFLSRRRSFPGRTCGSVFKNPPHGEAAGSLLEKSGAKNLSCGGAFVWSGHANVIVAGNGANSSDILVLASMMRRKVRELFDISLELEIRFADG